MVTNNTDLTTVSMCTKPYINAKYRQIEAIMNNVIVVHSQFVTYINHYNMHHVHSVKPDH